MTVPGMQNGDVNLGFPPIVMGDITGRQAWASCLCELFGECLIRPDFLWIGPLQTAVARTVYCMAASSLLRSLCSMFDQSSSALPLRTCLYLIGVSHVFEDVFSHSRSPGKWATEGFCEDDVVGVSVAMGQAGHTTDGLTAPAQWERKG
jgi:hypothetical protein